MNEDFWKTVDNSRGYSAKNRRTGVLNVTLLFGTAAIALSLILTPMLANKTQTTTRLAPVPDNIDNILTGSIKRTEAGKTYTIRKSILNGDTDSSCLVEGYNQMIDCR